MRETRSSSDSPSIETEAASIVRSEADAPSKTGMAWITVMSSSASSPGGASQTMAFATGRVDFGFGGGDVGFESAATGLASALAVDLRSTGTVDLAPAFAARFEADAGGGLVSLSSAGTLSLAALALAAFERLLPKANHASKNAATPVSVGATSCELSSTIQSS